MKDRRIAILFLTIFIDLLGFGIVIPILPNIAKSMASADALGFNPDLAVGITAAAFSLIQFIFAPMFGSVSDRIGRRPIIIGSILANAVGYLLFGYAANFVVLLVARVISGFGSANISAAQAYIADITTPAERAKKMGIIGAAFGLGFVFGPPIGGWLYNGGKKAVNQPEYGVGDSVNIRNISKQKENTMVYSSLAVTNPSAQVYFTEINNSSNNPIQGNDRIESFKLSIADSADNVISSVLKLYGDSVQIQTFITKALLVKSSNDQFVETKAKIVRTGHDSANFKLAINKVNDGWNVILTNHGLMVLTSAIPSDLSLNPVQLKLVQESASNANLHLSKAILTPIDGRMMITPAQKNGLKWVGIFTAALCLLNFILAFFLLPESHLNRTTHRRKASETFKVLITVWNIEVIGELFLINFIYISAFSMMQVNGSILWKEKYGLDEMTVGNIFGVIGICGAIVQGGLIGIFQKRLGLKKMLLIGCPLVGLGLGIIPIPDGNNMTWFYINQGIAILLLAIGNGLLMPSINSLVSINTPAGTQGTMLGSLQSLSSLARVIGPITAALIYSKSQNMPFYIAGVLMLVNLLLALMLSKKLKTDQLQHTPAPPTTE